MSFQFDHWEIDDSYLKIIQKNKLLRNKFFQTTPNAPPPPPPPAPFPSSSPSIHSISSKHSYNRSPSIHEENLSPDNNKKRKVQFNEKAKIVLIPCRQEYTDAGIDLWYHRQDQIQAQNELHQEINEMKIHHPKLSFRCILDYLFHLHPQFIGTATNVLETSAFSSTTSLPALEKTEELAPLSMESISTDSGENERETQIPSTKDKKSANTLELLDTEISMPSKLSEEDLSPETPFTSPKTKRQKITILLINNSYEESFSFAAALKESMKNHPRYSLKMKYIANISIALQFFQQYALIEEKFPSKLKRYNIDIVIVDTNIIIKDHDSSLNKDCNVLDKEHHKQHHHHHQRNGSGDFSPKINKGDGEFLLFETMDEKLNSKKEEVPSSSSPALLASVSSSIVPVRVPYLSQSSFDSRDNLLPSSQLPFVPPISDNFTNSQKLTTLFASIYEIYNNQIMIGILYNPELETVESLQNYIPTDNLVDFFWKKPITSVYYYSLLPFLLENHYLYYQDYFSSNHYSEFHQDPKHRLHHHHHIYSLSSSNDSAGAEDNNLHQTILPNCSYDSLSNDEDMYDPDCALETTRSSGDSSMNSGEKESPVPQRRFSASSNIDESDLIFTDVLSLNGSRSFDQYDLQEILPDLNGSFKTNENPASPSITPPPPPPPPLLHTQRSPSIPVRRSKRIDSISSVEDDPMFQNTFLNSFHEQSTKLLLQSIPPNRKLVKSESFTNGSSYLTTKQSKLQSQLKANAELYDEVSQNQANDGITSSIFNFFKSWGSKSRDDLSIPQDLPEKPFNPLKKAYSNDFLMNQKNYPARLSTQQQTQQPVVMSSPSSSSGTTTSSSSQQSLPAVVVKHGRVFI